MTQCTSGGGGRRGGKGSTKFGVFVCVSVCLCCLCVCLFCDCVCVTVCLGVWFCGCIYLYVRVCKCLFIYVQRAGNKLRVPGTKSLENFFLQRQCFLVLNKARICMGLFCRSKQMGHRVSQNYQKIDSFLIKIDFQKVKNCPFHLANFAIKTVKLYIQENNY